MLKTANKNVTGDVKLASLLTTKMSTGQKTPIRSPQIERLVSCCKTPKTQQKGCCKTPGKQGQTATSAAEKHCPAAGSIPKTKSLKTPNKTPHGDR
jgi:hypothetical protein